MSSRQNTKWNGWGATDKSVTIFDRVDLQPYLSSKLNIYYFNPLPALSLDELTLSPSRLTDGARTDLVSIVGDQGLGEDIESRAGHTLGKSYEDLVLARRGELSNPPDAVLFPSAAREVREILA